MSEQRITTELGETKLRLPELMRDTHGDARDHETEIAQMFAAVRQQLSELTASLRGDLEELRRLVSHEAPVLDSCGEDRDGLATAEVEFHAKAHAASYEQPPWLGPEVTNDPRDGNAQLAFNGAPPTPRTAPEPFRLHRREAMPAGIRRIACGQIDAAVDALGAGAFVNPSEAVHVCRKRFKRVRATARLVNGELAGDAYRLENAAFRDLGRRLSRARDGHVMLETLDALCARYALEIPPGAFADLRAALIEDCQASEQRLRERVVAGASIVDELRAARTRVAHWRLEHDAVSALAPGFERTYRRGRRAFVAARKDPTDENLHELRKRAKDIWHAAQILRPTAPKMMKTLADRAHRLSDLVGSDHDLAVLSQQVDQRPECLADEFDAALLHALIARRRRRVQREAIELAKRIFAAKPRELSRPVRRARLARAH
jgi:CHAD domain-containing protein